jgi:uncharacterized Fe-S center protein
MNSTVYYVPARADDVTSAQHGITLLMDRLDFSSMVREGDIYGIKVHVGEGDKRTFLGPELACIIAQYITRLRAKPFFTDTCVLYRSPRADAVSHTILARLHGYSFERASASFMVADGLIGTDEEMVEISVGNERTAHVAVASCANRANGLVVLCHPTGHLATGFGGALKTLGMGLSSRKGKLAMHSVSKPFIRKAQCTGCSECVTWCPEDAIEIVNEKAKINGQVCIGCGECLATCRKGAVGFDWKASSESLQKRIAEHAKGVLARKDGKVLCMSIALRVTKDCDCLQDPGPPLFPDIGLLGSADPVALDQATLDIIENQTGKSLRKWGYPQIDPTIQLQHAEHIGIGSRSYELITVG